MKKKPSVRRLETTELPLLTDLFAYNDVHAMIAENTVRMENGVIDIFALFLEDRPVGELRVKYDDTDHRFAEKEKRAYLYAFRVDEEYQGKGLGNCLLETVLNILSQKGYREVAVGVEDDNAKAYHIYQKHGFSETVAKIQESYQGDWYEYDLLLKMM